MDIMKPWSFVQSEQKYRQENNSKQIRTEQ